MTEYRIVPATLAHVEAMLGRLRQGDLDELAALGVAPEQALPDSLAGSLEAWVGMADGEPFYLFGLAPGALLGGSAVPWGMSTDGVDQHAPEFLRQSRRVANRWRRAWPYLFNYVDARYAASIRWLRWLGFTVHPAAPYGRLGMPFHRFDMGRP